MPREEYNIEIFQKGMRTNINSKDINERGDSNRKQGQRDAPVYSNLIENLKSPEWTNPYYRPITETDPPVTGLGSQGLGGSLATFDWELGDAFQGQIIVPDSTIGILETIGLEWLSDTKIGIQEVELPFWNGENGNFADFGSPYYHAAGENYLGIPSGQMMKIPHHIFYFTCYVPDGTTEWNAETAIVAIKMPTVILNRPWVNPDSGWVVPGGVTEFPFAESIINGNSTSQIPGSPWIVYIKEELAKNYGDMMSIWAGHQFIPEEFINTSECIRISFGSAFPMFSSYCYDRGEPTDATEGNQTSSGVYFNEKETAFYLGIAELPLPPVDWLHRDTAITQWDPDDSTDEMQYIHYSNFGFSPDVDWVFEHEDGTTATILIPGDRPYKVGVCFPQGADGDAFYSEDGHGYGFNPPNTSAAVVGEEVELGLSYYDILGTDGRIQIGRVLDSEGLNAPDGDKWEIARLPIDHSDGSDLYSSRQVQVKVHPSIKTGGIHDQSAYPGIEDRIDGLRLWIRKASDNTWKLLYDFNFTNGECVSGFSGEPHAMTGTGSHIGNKYWAPGESSYWKDFLDQFPGIPFEGVTKGLSTDIIHPSAGALCHVNNTMYIGDISYYDYIQPYWKKGLTQKAHNDRILFSRPGRPDAYSKNRRLEVATSDGFKITALKQDGDKLLMFKENTVIVISLAKSIPRVIYSKEYAGLQSRHHYTETGMGPMWMNSGGVFVFSSKGVVNLTENIININDWQDFYKNSSSLRIMYDERTNNVLLYDRWRGMFGGNVAPSGIGGVAVDPGIPKGYNLDLDHFSITRLSDRALKWTFLGHEPVTMFNTRNLLEENRIIARPIDGDARSWSFQIRRISPGITEVDEFIYESAELDLGSMGQSKKFKKLYVRYMANNDVYLNLYIGIDGAQPELFSSELDIRKFPDTSVGGVPFSGSEGVKVFDISDFAGMSIKIRLQRVWRHQVPGGPARESTAPGFVLNSLSLIYRKKLVR